MQYMLLVYWTEAEHAEASDAQRASSLAAYTAYAEALRQAGALVTSAGLQPSSTATVVRAPDGRPAYGTAPMSRAGSSSAATSSSTCQISTPLSPGRCAALAPSALPSRYALSWSTSDMADPGAHAAAATEAIARQSYGKLVAILASRSRDLAGAEDALSDAFASALADWPRHGLPQRPEAWLLATARRKMIDASRHRRVAAAASDHLTLLAEELQDTAGKSPAIPDQRLALMFACAHPAIDSGIRAPLILQAVLGFNARQIGSAFLVAPATMGARLSRAKNKIRAAGIPFRVPERTDLRDRLAAVLEAVYGAYASGWSDPAGADPTLRNLADEAIWLGRLVVELLPDEPEALGVLALMLYSHARQAARRDEQGEFVPLRQQNTGRWNTALIAEAEAVLFRASRLGAFGRYQLEAAIQSAHVAGRLLGSTDWTAIERLYEGLLFLTGSPVVQINLAIAVAQARGAEQALAALPVVTDADPLAQYQPYWAARAELLAQAGDRSGANAAFLRAIGLEMDPAVKRFLERRRAEST